MTRSLTISCLTVLVPALLCAQDSDDLRFGLEFSPNMSWIKPDMQDVDQNGTQFGYTFGLLADIPISSGNYAFGTGLGLNNIGGSISYNQDYTVQDPSDTTTSSARSVELSNDYRLQYLNIPLTIKLKTNEIGYITYFGQVGFDLGFNIRSKADMEVNKSTWSREIVERVEDEDVLDEIKFFRTALVVGAGIEYNFSGPTSVLIGITYNNGFSNVADKIDLVPEKKTKLLANYLELSAAVYF